MQIKQDYAIQECLVMNFMNMLKYLFIFILFIALLYLALINKKEIYANTSEEIYLLAKLDFLLKSEKDVIAAKELTKFAWNKFCIYGAYGHSLDVPWAGDEVYFTLKFETNKNSVYIKINRLIWGEMDSKQYGKCFESKDNVFFKIIKNNEPNNQRVTNLLIVFKEE